MSSQAELDTLLFSNKGKKEVRGIPGTPLNRPLVNNTLTGSLGLELEIEGVGLPSDRHLDALTGKDTFAQWRAIQDGSLRGEAREYVLTEPCSIEELGPMVTGLWNVFRDFGTHVNNSNRCSTHVHVNMKGLKVNHITSIIALWNTLEEALLEWCGEVRKTNHFCLASKDSLDTVQAWRSFLTNGRLPQERNLKYSSLNILPLWRLGSLEFRCGGPPDSPEQVIKWARFIHFMVRYAADNFENPMSIAYALSERGGAQIFSEICQQAELPDFYQEVIFLNPDFDRKCIEGFRNAQSLSLGFPWEEWLELINREYVPNPFDKGGAKKETRLFIQDMERMVERPHRAPVDEARNGLRPRAPYVVGDRRYDGQWVIRGPIGWTADQERRGLNIHLQNL